MKIISASQEDALPKQIGEAIVSWSQIEATWAHIFLYLVYAGIGEPLELDPETGVPIDPHSAEKRSRAASIFFSVPNSRSQRGMVVELAKVALKDHPDIVGTLKKLAKRTDDLSAWRNKFAHAYYERPWTIRRGKFVYGAISVSALGKHQFTEADLTAQIGRFEQLNRQMDQMMLAVAHLDEPPTLNEPEAKTAADSTECEHRGKR